MRSRTKFTIAGLGLIGAGLGTAVAVGSARWNAETVRQVAEVERGAASKANGLFSSAHLDGLPEPVSRYFRFALTDGQPLVRTAWIGHKGEFNLNGKWIPFESEQVFSADPPAFVWNARMWMNPLLGVRVRDGYRAGRGSVMAKIFGLVTMADAGGADERLASGALMRFLAESAWMPTALLPRDGLRWTPINDSKAMATLTDVGVTVSLEFTFGSDGQITGIYSPERYKEVDGEYRPFPWAGRFWNYQQHGGMMIPAEGEVEWRMPNRNEPYWRGRVTGAEYEFAE